MLKFPKVVVCCPTYDGKNYCLDAWLNQYEAFTYPNKDLVMVDNSATKDNYKKLKKLGVKNVYYVNPRNKPVKQILAESHEHLRQYVVGVDSAAFMFHLESDMFPDNTDIVQELMITNKSVVSPLYPIRTGQERELNIMLCEEDNNLLAPHRYTYYLGKYYQNYVDGKVNNCFSAGMGAILIHRTVLKRIKFRFFKELEMLPDFIFANDLWNSGINNFIHTGLYCKHLNTEWFKEKNRT